MELRRKLGVESEPYLHPIGRFMVLNAFWQHWSLHRRACGKTGKPIVSVYAEDCPYPVWHKDEWVKHADPPGADLKSEEAVFPQLWAFFSRSPIAHNIGVGSENCEYTDDWWYSKNCYLSHSGIYCEDARYCYRVSKVRDGQFCVFSFDSERCTDIINCHNCFQVRYAQNCWQCADSAFLYDCKNCQNCMFSCNLRNKQYYFDNEQLTKEEYGQKAAMWDMHSRATYERGKTAFNQMMRKSAWHRALFVDRCESVSGNYLDQCKDTHNCFFSNIMRDCANIFRAYGARDCVDCISAFASERIFNSAMPQDKCYDMKCCYNVSQSKWMEYCAHCLQCENCFGCCGLVGKKYHIFNKPYAPEEYEKKKVEIIAAMQRSGEYGQFFPGYFAAVPYEETLANFHWPLSRAKAKELGFRVREKNIERSTDALDSSAIPDRSDDADANLPKRIFWDDVAGRQFQIQQADIDYCKTLGVPLPNTQYARRLQENFHRIPCNGQLREIACGRCERTIPTSWPEEYDGRILCEDCYLKEVY